MNLIVETDLGHDPDDFFALCYLHSAGVNIRAILLTKGYPYQVEIARFFCDSVGLDIPIGIAATEPKPGGVNFHDKILKHYGYQSDKPADAPGHEVITSVLAEYPDCRFFVCGPPKSFGAYLEKNPEAKIDHVTVQGGFLSYDQHQPRVRLEKFENKATVPTFNLNGAKKETLRIVDFQGIKDLRFVSKNVCHTIVYDRALHRWMKDQPVENKADELFLTGMDIYLKSHEEKKFHDPTAAVCLLHPEIAEWYEGKLYNEKGGWGTRSVYPRPLRRARRRSWTIADIDRDKLWHHLRTRT